MGKEQRMRKIRQQINYKPGHPGSETKYDLIQHHRKVRAGGKLITINTATRVCEGIRSLYRRMKKVDAIIQRGA